jgi:hypothetical protein
MRFTGEVVGKALAGPRSMCCTACLMQHIQEARPCKS